MRHVSIVLTALAGIALVFATTIPTGAQSGPSQAPAPPAINTSRYGNPQQAYGPNATVGDTVEAVRAGAHLQDLYRAGNPHVTRQVIKLSPAQCQQRVAAVPAGMRSQAQALVCTILRYHFHAAHLPLPAGITPERGGTTPLFHENARAALPTGWWYWTNTDTNCDLFCAGWGSTDWADGVDNGMSVWDWHQQCTPFGIAQFVDCFVNVRRDGAW